MPGGTGGGTSTNSRSDTIDCRADNLHRIARRRAACVNPYVLSNRVLCLFPCCIAFPKPIHIPDRVSHNLRIVHAVLDRCFTFTPCHQHLSVWQSGKLLEHVVHPASAANTNAKSHLTLQPLTSWAENPTFRKRTRVLFRLGQDTRCNHTNTAQIWSNHRNHGTDMIFAIAEACQSVADGFNLETCS